MTESFHFRPRPPVEESIAPWTELPSDPAHPTFEDAPRLFVERHHHSLYQPQLEEWQTIPITAVFVSDGLTGNCIEFGPWTLEPDEARLLALSLTTLANALDQKGDING